METMIQTIPFQAEQPIFNKVGNISELIHMTADERARYNISIDSYRTNLSAMKNERAEGVAEGMAKGRAEGRAEGVAEGMAKGIQMAIDKMRASGMPDSQIEEILQVKL